MFNIAMDVKEAGDYSIQMIDMLGRTVYFDEINVGNGSYTLPVDASDVNKGMYQLVIKTKGKQQVFKLIVK